MIAGTLQKREGTRWSADAGIAIGPILFIISILGILAAAIAAGSGSFTTGTSSESNRAKAAAMIDIGQNLKIGFDRILSNGIAFADIVINPANTTAKEDLFSPSGGGITAPSVTMAADPSSDVWHYPLIDIPRLGTGDGNRVAVLRVEQGVCEDINTKVAALAPSAIATPVDLGDFASTSNTPIDGSLWPSGLQGKLTGCVNNANSDTIDAGYYFYQVLGLQ